MQKQAIDFGRLLGFDAVAEQASKGMDFQCDTISARIGAKVGVPEPGASVARKLDCSKLLGFAAVAGELAKGIDFRDDTFSDKVGAKVGPVEPLTPENNSTR
jgi:hypothetical protein